jgi:transposase/predicted transcriptional regulator
LKALYGATGLKILSYDIKGENLTIHACGTKKKAHCPSCHKSSGQIRSGYTRKLMDLPSGNYRSSILLEVRKFKCSNENCPQKIFSEQFPDYAKPYSRKTNRATELLSSILIEISSRKGSHISGLLHMNQSPSTCLRIVLNLPIPVNPDLEVIGIDDWAFKKGVSYGTLFVNAKTGRPIDVIKSRGEAEVTLWLKKHSGIKIITRDRASSYSKAITTALPSCEQVADKFHIVKNLSERVYEIIKKQYSSIEKEFTNFKIESNVELLDTSTATSPSQPGIVEVRKEKVAVEGGKPKEILYNKVHELHNAGVSTRKTAAILQISRNTVRHYLRYDNFPERRIVYRNNYQVYLDIISEECKKGKNKKEIFNRIKQCGFKGELTAFYVWFNKNCPQYKEDSKTALKEMKEKYNNPAILFSGLSPRKISIYVCNSQWGISKNGIPSKEHSLVEQIVQSSPLLQYLREIVLSFRNILKSKTPKLLDEWMQKVELKNLPDINSFVKGLKADIAAVRNAIIYPWTNGFEEGSVNRLKTKKREMYGRAGFELLRRKIVLSKMG